MAAEYILHDAIDDGESRYAPVSGGGAVSGGHLSSSLMLGHDDLEIPLIGDSGSLGGGAPGGVGGGGGAAAGHGPRRRVCSLGQRGFRPAQSEHSSNKTAKQQLVAATVICTLFMVAELVGGLMAGSLAVVTDAAHLLTDCIGFVVAMVAISIAKKSPDRRMTFGYKRCEVLGAFFSVLGIWLLTGILVYLAVLRVLDQSFEIDADTMIVISTIGVGINVVMASVLHGNCLKVPISHGHSHGAGGGGCGGHSHGHSHKGGRASKSAGQLSATATNSVATTLPRKDDPLLSHGVVNMHSTSIHTTHSRHNSFSKTLPNGANLLLDTGDLNGGTNISLSSSSVHRPHSRQNGSYTLLSIGSNDDTNNHHHHSCDSEDDEEEEEHLHEELSDDDEGLGGSDLKLGKEKDARPAGNINIRAAMIHVIGDFVQSVGVLISALVIKFYPEAKLVDPACTFVFSVIVFLTTIRIMKECLRVLLNAVPLTINLAQLEKELRSVHGVLDVHFLNVFAVSVDWNVLATHMVIDNMTSGEEVIRSVTRVARRGYSIKHVTVQIERQRKKSLSLINGHHHGNELI